MVRGVGPRDGIFKDTRMDMMTRIDTNDLEAAIMEAQAGMPMNNNGIKGVGSRPSSRPLSRQNSKDKELGGPKRPAWIPG